MATQINEYISVTASQDVDTVEICPKYPEYMVVGTYSLQKSAGGDDQKGQTRYGTLLVMPVTPPDAVSSKDGSFRILCQETFPHAIVELHFHPEHGDVFGAATSEARLHMFQIRQMKNKQDQESSVTLVYLGTFNVAEDEDSCPSHLVTQFTWMTGLGRFCTRLPRHTLPFDLVASTSLGQALLVRGRLPYQDGWHGVSRLGSDNLLPQKVAVVSNHDLEAWTVATTQLYEMTERHNILMLSGADDSKLMASNLCIETGEENMNDEEDSGMLCITPVWSLRRNHDAGIVSILPLPPHQGQVLSDVDNAPQQTSQFGSTRFLTGSYDEHIRLFQLNSKSANSPPKQIAEQRLDGGGVWRIKLMDYYTTSYISTFTETDKSDKTPFRNSNSIVHHYILLISCMHAGAKIVRMTSTTALTESSDSALTTLPPKEDIMFTIEAEFTAGHTSMVYSCDYRREPRRNRLSSGQGDGALPEGQKGVLYTMVSTSFYDRKICIWQWRDEVGAGSN